MKHFSETLWNSHFVQIKKVRGRGGVFVGEGGLDYWGWGKAVGGGG